MFSYLNRIQWGQNQIADAQLYNDNISGHNTNNIYNMQYRYLRQIIEPCDFNSLPQINYIPDNCKPYLSLKTDRQLVLMGLAPRRPAVFYTASNTPLYDINDPASVYSKKELSVNPLKRKMKGAMKKAFRNSYWYRELPFCLDDIHDAIDISRKLLKKENVLIVDTETTGLHGASIVEIGVIDLKGNVRLNSLINPGLPIPEEATSIHGIRDEDVSNQETFEALYPTLKDIISGNHILFYNKDFDKPLIDNECRRYQLPLLQYDSSCIMLLYAKYCNSWSERKKSYIWKPLDGGHRAVSDCYATLKRIKTMAEAKKLYKVDFVRPDFLHYFGRERVVELLENRGVQGADGLP